MKLLYCEVCDDMMEYTVVSKEETFNVLNKEAITILSKIAVCVNCQTELFEEELEKENQRKAFNIYRKNNNVLFPEEIAEIRNKYGLTQKEMSKLLGWGEITYHRYEKGSIPDQAHNSQLLLIRDPKNVLQIIENGSHGLTDEKTLELTCRIEKLLESNIQTKEIHLTLPLELYNDLRLYAEKIGMELEEYIRYRIMQNHYEDRIKNTKDMYQEVNNRLIQELAQLSKDQNLHWRDYKDTLGLLSNYSLGPGYRRV